MIPMFNKLTVPWEWWTTYWFKLTPLFNLAISRIIIVGSQLFYLLVPGRDGTIVSQLVNNSQLPDFLYNPLPILKIILLPFGLNHPPPVVLLLVILALTIITGTFGLIGLSTNLNLIIFAIGNILIQAYIYSFGALYSHSQALVMISLVILALSPAGQVLSLDDLRRRIRQNCQRKSVDTFDIQQEKSHLARWPLLLIQWMFAIIYLDSAMSKLLKGGLDWMNGYTLQYYLWQDGLVWDRPLGIWLARQHTLAMLSSWVAILFEATFFFVLVFPRLIWFYIPLGICFHTGIYIAQNAPFLKYIPCYSVFIPWAELVGNVSERRRLDGLTHNPEIIYNKSDNHCLTIITVLSYFNWFNRLTFRDLQTQQSTQSDNMAEIVPDDYKKPLYLVLPSGSKRKGFLAFRESLRYLPPLWLLYPVLSLPFISKISANLYQSMESRQ